MSAMRKPREVIQPRWGVFILKHKAERLSFTVTGRNSEEAMERAIKEYDAPERERFPPERSTRILKARAEAPLLSLG
jgi:hypothetical protein